MNNFGFFAGSIPFPPLTGFVPYVGATQDVNLGIHSLISPQIIGGTIASANLTLSSTSNATKGKILFGASAYDEVNNRLGIGTISPAFDFDLIKSVPASYVGANVQNTNATGYSFIEVLGDNNTTYASLNVFNSAGGVGTFYDNNTAGVAVNAATLGFLVNENATGGWVITAGGYGTAQEKVRITTSATRFNQAAVSSGAVNNYSFTKPNNTGQTASTNIQGFLFTTGSRQWATGAITTQEEIRITSPTYSFVGASTITNAYSLFVNAPTAGTNATITNNWAIGTNGRVNVQGSSSDLINVGTNDGGFYNIKLAYNGVIGSTTGAGQLGSLGANALGFYLPTSAIGMSRLVNTWTSAKISYEAYQHHFQFFSSANQTAEYSRFLVTGNQVNFTAAIATQRFNYFTAPTIAFNSANTVTNSYSLYVEAAIAGTNATITNNYALGISGGIEVASGNSLFRGVVTIARGLDANVTNFSVSSGTANTSVFSLNTDQPNSRVLLTSRNSNTLNFGTQDLSRAFFDTAGNFNIGNASSTNQRQVRIGQDTAFLDIGSFAGSTANSAIYFNASNPGAFATTIYGNSSSITVQGASGSNIAVGGFNAISINSFLEQTYTNFARTSGAFTAFTWTKANSTGQTASTNIQGWLFTTGSRQWATGNITTQQEILITSPTYSFTGASTITNAYTLFVNAPTAGTNATITNNWAAGFSGNVHINNNLARLYIGNDSVTSTSYALGQTAANEISLNAASTLRFRINNSIIATITSSDMTFNGSAGLVMNNAGFDGKILFTRTGGNSHSIQLDTNRFYIYNNTAGVERLGINNAGSVIVGNAAIATNATDGFLYIPSCAGIPTGTPTTQTGRVPIVVDSTNNRMYIYSGGAWVALN